METQIKIIKLYKFTKKWKVKKANRAVALMNKVINSDLFDTKILAYKFTDRRYRFSVNDDWREMTDNNEILGILKKGNEQFSERKDDYVWNLKIKLGKYLRQVGRRERDLIITPKLVY